MLQSIGFFFTFGRCLAVCALLVLFSAISAGTARASDFAVVDSDGARHSAVLLSARADVEVNGLLVYGTLTQKFLNTGPDFVAGEYVFPLPDGASVDSLLVRIGGRTVEAVLREKARAAATFAAAKADGKQAALLQLERPNLFRLAVANIGAGEEIDVELRYVDTVRQDGDTYRLSLPTTLTPRYSPLGPVPELESEERAPSDDGLNTFLNPLFTALSHTPSGVPNNPIDIRIELKTGFTALAPTSTSHLVAVQQHDDMHYSVKLSNGFEPMDRDFHLSWQQNNPATAPTLYVESVSADAGVDGEAPTGAATEHYMLLSVVPSAATFPQRAVAKDVTFIIDTSGSMGGEPIRQARAALQHGLDRLTPEDSFNIIEFNDQHSSLFSASHPASGDYLSAARRFVQQLDAGGGTEMEPALLQALRRPAVSPEHLKQVVFITDGAVGNEAALTRLVHQFLGDARLFSVGIGSAPNQYLFRQLSTLGKGTSVTIAEVGDVHDAMQRLFDKISAPAMRDIALVDAEGKLLEIEPNRIPDLYYGEPLNVLLRVSEPVGAVQLEGTLAGETLAVPLQLQQATPAAGVGTLWGRAKIRALNDKLYLGQGDPTALRQAIVDVSLKHRVLSEYTSYVAVDDQPVRRADQSLLETQVANILPQGMAFPTTALGTLPTFLVSLLSLLAAALIKAWRIFSVGTARESAGLDRLAA